MRKYTSLALQCRRGALSKEKSGRLISQTIVIRLT